MSHYERAKKYEKNNQILKALEEYKQAILEGDEVENCKIALLRLDREWQKFEGVDEEKKLLFVIAQSDEEMQRLEGWLLR